MSNERTNERTLHVCLASSDLAVVRPRSKPAMRRGHQPTVRAFVLALGAVLGTSTCGEAPTRLDWPDASTVGPTRFNQLAVRLDLPLFWVGDANGEGAPDPDEIRTLLFYPGSDTDWTRDGQFTPAFLAAAERILRADREPSPADVRLELVESELDAGSPTLVATDTAGWTDAERSFLAHMERAARLIDSLYARQLGLDPMLAMVASDDAPSQSLFRRNWGPWCLTLTLRNDRRCSAIAGDRSGSVLGVYPASLQQTRADVEALCPRLSADPEAASLLDPYTIVLEAGGRLAAARYTAAYEDQARAIQIELRAATDALHRAGASVTFTDALSSMGASFDRDRSPIAHTLFDEASGWFLEIGATGSNWDWCRHKAAFRMTLGRRDDRHVGTFIELAAVVQAAASSAASTTLATDPRAPSSTAVPLDLVPIDIVLQAGASRWPLGALVGETTRHREYVFTNLGSDGLSRARRSRETRSLFDATSLRAAGDSLDARATAIGLHELAHALDTDASPVSSRVFVELRADALALVLSSALAPPRRQSVQLELLREAVYGAARPPETAASDYQAAAAVELGLLLETDALRWDATAPSADESQTGAFVLDFDRIGTAGQGLLRRAIELTRADGAAERATLLERYLRGTTVPIEPITQRLGSSPEPNYVYSTR